MSEVYVPKIRPVRVKTEEIPQSLINPGSMGYDFPQAAGPRAVYLDERYDYPDDKTVEDVDAERERQDVIWRQIESDGGLRFLDRQVEAGIDFRQVHAIRENVYADLGTRDTAEFYERVLSELMSKTMDVVVISTGVRPFDGENYHDIGFLLAQ